MSGQQKMKREEAQLKKLHEYEKDAFKKFIDLCDANHIRYYAIGGTLLGGVRHKGFIPWDDDIDVAMPRPDYERFLKIAPKKLPEELVMDDFHTNKEFRSYFAKIRNKNIELRENLVDNEATTRIGYLIDIIPLDGTPDSAIGRKLYYAKVMIDRFLCGAANVNTGIRTSRPKKEQMLLHICKFLRLYKILDIQKIYRRMDRLFRKQDYEHSKYVGTIMGAYNVHEIVPRWHFGDYKKRTVWPFEGFEINGPEKCDAYLKHMFGDYMKLPPKSKRKIHYQSEIIEKDKNHE